MFHLQRDRVSLQKNIKNNIYITFQHFIFFSFRRFNADNVVTEWKRFSKMIKQVDLRPRYLTVDILSQLFDESFPDITRVIVGDTRALEVLYNLFDVCVIYIYDIKVLSSKLPALHTLRVDRLTDRDLDIILDRGAFSSLKTLISEK